MRVTLLHNPQAGCDAPSKEDLLAALQEAGYDPAYRSAEGNLAEALRDPGELVVVAGGDGTVGQAVQHLFGRGIPLAVLPLGTANNISKTFGLAGAPQELIAAWDPARRQSFDVGVARGPWGTRRFLEAVGLGLFPRVMAVDEEKTQPARFFNATGEKLSRDLALLKGELATFSARHWTVRLDGQDLSGRYLLLEVMNIPFIGPNLPLAPEADPGDAHFDLVLLPEDRRDVLDAYLAERLDGRDESLDLPRYRGQHVHLAWKGALVHLDDARWPVGAPSAPAAEADLRVEPGALEVLVPA